VNSQLSQFHLQDPGIHKEPLTLSQGFDNEVFKLARKRRAEISARNIYQLLTSSMNNLYEEISQSADSVKTDKELLYIIENKINQELEIRNARSSSIASAISEPEPEPGAITLLAKQLKSNVVDKIINDDVNKLKRSMNAIDNDLISAQTELQNARAILTPAHDLEKSVYLAQKKLDQIKTKKERFLEETRKLEEIDTNSHTAMAAIDNQRTAINKLEKLTTISVPPVGTPIIYREASTIDQFKFETTLIHLVDDSKRNNTAEEVIKDIQLLLSSTTKKPAIIAAQDSSTVTFRKYTLVEGQILQTVGKLRTGVLYLETDHTARVTSRSWIDVQNNKMTLENAQDLSDIAIEHAKHILDHYKPEKGPIIISAEGAHDAHSANRLYAALLFLAQARNIKNMEIISKVYGCDGPGKATLYGQKELDNIFIKEHLVTNLRVNEEAHKDTSKKYAKQMKQLKKSQNLDAGESTKVDGIIRNRL
jgi:hypothetical protein